jgi:hypothetical protein
MEIIEDGINIENLEKSYSDIKAHINWVNDAAIKLLNESKSDMEALKVVCDAYKKDVAAGNLTDEEIKNSSLSQANVINTLCCKCIEYADTILEMQADLFEMYNNELSTTGTDIDHIRRMVNEADKYKKSN